MSSRKKKHTQPYNAAKFSLSDTIEYKENQMSVVRQEELNDALKNSTRAEVLTSALEVVNGERQSIYGDPVKAHTMVAEMASTLLQDKLYEPLTAKDIAMLMIVLKLVRGINNKNHHQDTYVDIAGYSAIAGEISKTHFDILKNTQTESEG